MEVYLRRTLNGFVASDDVAADELRKVKVGESVRAKIVTPRNPRSAQQNRLYWKLCQVVLDNTEQFSTREQVSDYLKIQAGHCDQTHIKIPEGKPDEKGRDNLVTVLWLQPRSIAFDKMGHSEFQEYWRKALDIIAQRIIPMSPEQLEAEVYEMIGEVKP